LLRASFATSYVVFFAVSFDTFFVTSAFDTFSVTSVTTILVTHLNFYKLVVAISVTTAVDNSARRLRHYSY
jgi:hypothetical protein